MKQKSILSDFICTELSNRHMLNDLLLIAKTENIAECEYECNQYNVIFSRSERSVMIKDAVSEEYGVLRENTECSVSLSEFIDILTSKL